MSVATSASHPDHTIQLGSGTISNTGPCYIIAEIGQNHQGSVSIAKRMIVAAKESGADCVKFQKSDLPTKFTRTALHQPYDSPNAWAATYGQHKAHLEFSVQQYDELQHYAEHIVGIPFTASAMDTKSVRLLGAMRVPFIKIGSGDANNIPLLELAASMPQPLVISTGMQTELMIGRIARIMRHARKRDFVLLHCVSAYPTGAADVRLRMLGQLRQWFPDVCIGYSGHELGIGPTLASVVLGAKVIERHFTIDPTMKGTDHQISLTPNAFRRLVDCVRALEASPAGWQSTVREIILNNERCGAFDVVAKAFESAGIRCTDMELDSIRDALLPLAVRDPHDGIAECERPCWQKLGKSLVYSSDLRAGQRLRCSDVCFKVSPSKGLLDDDYDAIEGKRLRCDVGCDEPVAWTHLEECVE